MIYWTVYNEGSWYFTIAATEQGLCYTGSAGEGFEQLQQWAAKAFPQLQLVQDEQKLANYTKQFQQYFSGARQRLTFPVHINGTVFQQEVWQALKEIPFGQSCSYGDLAERIGRPNAVRAVGAAIGANPVMIVIPCHRVIGKNGTLTGFRGGLEMKARLLQLENIAYKK